MRKSILSVLAAVAAFALASCVKEPVSAPDPARGGEPVPVSFSVNLRDVLTKAAPVSSDFDNASGEFKLYAAAFSKENGALISTSKIGGSGFQPVETVSGKNVNVVLTLSKSQDYKVVFFAMHDGAYDVNFADGNVATFAFKRELKANDASQDAFYASVDVSASSNKYDVTMKRPFAQLNVLVPKDKVPGGQTAFSSSMTVTAPAGFDLYGGKAGTDLQELAFASNAIAADPVGNYKETHVWIGMNFVLVPESGTVTVTSFAESGMLEPVRIGTVPVKVNSRTNIVGSIYSLSDFFFNLQINPDIDDEQESPIEGGESGGGGEGGGSGSGETQDTEISIVGGDSYTEATPLAIDASGASAAKSVSIRVNGDDFATVEAGAGGAKVTATSSDTDVATAEIKDGAVLITPTGNGKAKITVSTPAYTKTDYKAQTFEFWVEVTGMSSGGGTTPVTATLTVSPTSLNLTVGQSTTLTATTNSSATPTFSTSNGAVATVGTDGTVTAVAAGTATITVSVAAVEGAFTAASKTVPVTVTAGGGSTQEGDGTKDAPYTVAQALAVTNALDPKGETASKVYVKGIISEITEVNTGEYGNATYFISDNGSKTGQLQVFRGYYLGNAKFTAADQIKVNDEVIVYGKLKNYQNSDNSLTPEITGSEIYSLNGQTAGGSGGQGGGGEDLGDSDATLTNAEIKTATVDASMTDDSTHYGDASITSSSGTWTGNFGRNKNGLNYLQLRNKNGAFITSPTFSSAISKVAVTLTSEDVQLSDRTLHAVPPATTLPNGKDSSGKDITYSATEWANEYGCVRTGSEKGATVVIDFAEGSNVKQFMLIVEGGATYIDHIDVYY